MKPMKYKPYTRMSIQTTKYWEKIPEELREAILIISYILPFRTNEYVLDELIDWNKIPNDPMYRLIFPHPDMLSSEEYSLMRNLTYVKKDPEAIKKMILMIRMRMNPHPAGQLTHNVPYLNGIPLRGIQHKYKETVLFFPSAGQTCHAYCTFCFRWPQFVGMDDFKFDAKNSDELVIYLKQQKEVTDVLITGGDPLIMNTESLTNYIEPLLIPELEHIQNIRIGTKSVSYWPHRFVSEKDSDNLLRLFEKVIASGRNLAIMAHYSHPVELYSNIAKQAARRIVGTGATLRMQSPLIRHVNDDPKNWIELWQTGVRLGAIPYYMFVERDTGPRHYFHLPLVNAYNIFREAYQSVSGLARTVRGPSMSAFPGKVLIDGIAKINDEKVFVLQFLQGIKSQWVRKPFFAKYDQTAIWFDDLIPAFGKKKFFFEEEYGKSQSRIKNVAVVNL